MIAANPGLRNPLPSRSSIEPKRLCRGVSHIYDRTRDVITLCDGENSDLSWDTPLAYLFTDSRIHDRWRSGW